MIAEIKTDGKNKLPGMAEDRADSFIKKTEELFAWLLDKNQSLPPSSECAEISLSIVSPERMRDLNFQYRDVDASTDVLSFPLWEEGADFIPPEGWKCIPLGDIVICPEKIMENAADNCRSFMQELVLVISHGFLHLIGYDHSDQGSEVRMWAEQESMVERFFSGECGEMAGAEKYDFDADALMREAKKAGKRAYAPYSDFPVGAAILFEDGSIVSGCNVENCSYGLSICAERNAMAAAVSGGRMNPIAVAVAGTEGKACPPCGACRQFLSEFNGDMAVVLEEEGKTVIYKLSGLLPMQFMLTGRGETGDDR